jgi:hypothetical protein
MWNGSLVVDGVAHAYTFGDDNRRPNCPPEVYNGLIDWIHGFLHLPLESTAPGFRMSRAEYGCSWTAEDLASVFFEESDVDVIAYHGVEIDAFFNRGSSPWSVGVELKKAFPDRVLLYCPVDPLKGEAELERMQARHEECPVDGWKCYPTNGIIDPAIGGVEVALFDDRELAFPFWEKALELGVPRVAVHKAMPVGPGRLDKDNVHDVSGAAVAFPQIQFEVVHAGWAFLEDSALQMMLHPNIWANLENVANFAVRQPRKFAHILGTLLQYAGDQRIMFGTGCCAAHPQPILEALANFEMPQDLIDGYGFPEVTDETKRRIFGENIARLHGFDPAERAAALAGDAWSQRRAEVKAAAAEHGATPWRAHRARHGFATV